MAAVRPATAADAMAAEPVTLGPVVADPAMALDVAFDGGYRAAASAYLTAERNTRDTDTIVALLGLGPGAEVLDLGCGDGRISCELADRGVRVVGLDRDECALEEARQRAHDRGVAVTFAGGDMRQLPWRQRFDAVVSWYSSIGYFDDSTERAILAGVRRALRPGGRFLLEHVNRDRALRGFQRYDVADHGGVLMIDDNRFDPVTGRTVKRRTYYRGGEAPRACEYTIRLFTVPELREWLYDAGFARVAAFGAAGEPFTLDSPRLIVVAS